MYTMYPDWPLSSADLVPLPRCDGPKLEPFDFFGAQAIDFLGYIGEGLHAHVFKVQIRGQMYALKLFRFTYDDNWLGPAIDTDPDDRELMSAFYDYSEPFSCECRAFGRLQEAGHQELAVDCFGYVLLDEDHERALHSRFPDVQFDGDIKYAGGDEMRTRFLGRDGRAPPIRGIVKELGDKVEEDELQPAELGKLLGDIGRLQQLGIMRLDVGARQLVGGGRMCDFSQAITVPHYLTTPELNPGLTARMRRTMELETFRLALDDFLAFDEMMHDWNLDHADKKGAVAVRAFPGGNGSPPLRRYELRNMAARERVFTYVDPRQYNWKRRTTKGVNNTCRRRLRAKPPMWVFHCGMFAPIAARLRSSQVSGPKFEWDYKDGLIFPRI